jgi:hypothetical protein
MSKPTFPNMVNLVLGDWSHDGHSMTETVTISCNLDKKALESAYKKGTKKLGVDVDEDVASDYEDSTISFENWQKFAAAGMTLEQLFDDNDYDVKESTEAVDNEEAFNIYHSAFVKLWLFTAKQGNPEFEYTIEEDNSPNINIGGYGLFGS